MALALSSSPRVTTALSRRPQGHRTRTSCVSVKALSVQEASDWFAKAFVRIFSPDDSKVEQFPSNPWTGRISRSKKPFKDGFVSNAPLPPSSALEPTEDAAGYVEDAVKGVVAGFPKTEEAEPNWTGATTAWRGEVHKSDNKRDSRDGFHVKRY
ncbi:hypothetical protein VOLCADRAFT_107643 [Volvox carteri f. nagariensis]|uniref:Upf5 n=1 Tax=Volvox carteri f. nagariensis TaxID=3068 RepID=A1YQZ6_VOLCA|nr:uncharacterized protein VOLCADRAFT_107643 [Volvox carteri f. nagariensis]ABM47328.1 Upf5 [Volvox carteri f. nagariensis]EFJ41552.1 hypothetical protein VOLCADRAFT_107643 [Volvox carteri f. nagariensis]|eukprot:XP_002957343.1 hypothetical protein VOLCADRAFT_107643 [Volvox carteri f. nagariensis]